jgi:hypothetical protein
MHYSIIAKLMNGQLITAYNSMDKSRQARLLGYAEALMNHYGKKDL